jgi:hypothetical protein
MQLLVSARHSIARNFFAKALRTLNPQNPASNFCIAIHDRSMFNIMNRGYSLARTLASNLASLVPYKDRMEKPTTIRSEPRIYRVPRYIMAALTRRIVLRNRWIFLFYSRIRDALHCPVQIARPNPCAPARWAHAVRQLCQRNHPECPKGLEPLHRISRYGALSKV